MHFGFALPGRGPLARPDVLVKLAEKADALRYSSIFVTDHVVIPTAYDSKYPYSSSGKAASDWDQGYLEPLALMSFLAGVTSRVRLGTSVLVVPYRNPVVTAKMLATLDVMSGGRIILGAGVGWLREEFEALHSPPYEQRGRVTDEYLRLMKDCWTREPVEWSGTHYRMGRVSVLPKPVQKGGIPIWTGGHTDAALRRTGELADGWHPIGHRDPARLYPAEYAEKVAVIHGWARKAGRDAKDITLSLRAPLELVPNRPHATGRARSARPDGALRRGSAPESAQGTPERVRLTGRHAMTKRPPAAVPLRARVLPAQSRRGGGLGRGAEPPFE
ncbi:MAG: LLM class F420-dependent oxidoreductase [Candidatus Rokuibacteriota bacterium]|nr:MAG: LLM class F420-dependent oxidoreductase [Candidatus Rokubacteria bacterium]